MSFCNKNLDEHQFSIGFHEIFAKNTKKEFSKSLFVQKKYEFLLLPFSYVKVWFQRPWENCSNRFYRDIKIFNRKVTFFVIKNVWFVYSPISGTEIQGSRHADGTTYSTIWITKNFFFQLGQEILPLCK